MAPPLGCCETKHAEMHEAHPPSSLRVRHSEEHGFTQVQRTTSSEDAANMLQHCEHDNLIGRGTSLRPQNCLRGKV